MVVDYAAHKLNTLNPFPSLSLSVSSPCKPVHTQTHYVYMFRQSTGKERNDIQFSLRKSRVCSELFHYLSHKSLSSGFPPANPFVCHVAGPRHGTPLTSTDYLQFRALGIPRGTKASSQVERTHSALRSISFSALFLCDLSQTTSPLGAGKEANSQFILHLD